MFPYSNWSAREEKKFIDLMLVNGFGNWEGIAKEMKSKTSDECRDHYVTHYLDGNVGKMVGLTKEPYTPLTVPYLYKINSVEPPRHDLESHNFKEMAGYRCARGDFDTPYDNSAEMIVSNLDLKNWSDCDADVSEALNCAMFNVYNHRLRYKHMIIENCVWGLWSRQIQFLDNPKSQTFLTHRFQSRFTRNYLQRTQTTL